MAGVYDNENRSPEQERQEHLVNPNAGQDEAQPHPQGGNQHNANNEAEDTQGAQAHQNLQSTGRSTVEESVDDTGTGRTEDEGEDVRQSKATEAAVAEGGASEASPFAPKGKEGGKKKGSKLKWIRKHRKMFFAMGGLTAAVMPFVIIIFLFFAALELPNFAHNMENFDAALLARNASTLDDRVIGEKAAIDGADNTKVGVIRNTWGVVRGKTTALWTAMQKLNLINILRSSFANKVAEAASKFSFSYTTEKQGFLRARLTTVTVNGQDFEIKQGGIAAKFIPGLQFTRNASLIHDIFPVMNDTMKLANISWFWRDQAIKGKIGELGILFRGWRLAGYTGKSEDLTQARDSEGTINKSDPGKSLTAATQNATDEATQDTQAALNDDKKLQAAVEGGGVSTQTAQAVESKLASGSRGVTGFFRKLGGFQILAIEVCTLQDDLLVHAGPTIDAQTHNAERTGALIESEASQMEAGAASSAQIDAAVRQLEGTSFGRKDTTASNVEIKANGGTPDTSQNDITSSPSGDYTFATAPFGNGTAAQLTQKFLNDVCPALTSDQATIALAAGQILPCFTGAGCLGEQAVKEGAQTLLGRVVQRLVGRIASEKVTGKLTAISGVITNGLKSAIKVDAINAAIIYLERGVVYHNSLSNNNGLQSGADFANNADSGMIALSSQMSQQVYGGRPLTSTELAQSQNADKKMLISMNQSQSVFDRYFGTANAQSLVSKLAMRMQPIMGSSIFANFSTLCGKIFNPLSSLASVFGFWENDRVSAAVSSINTANVYYGNVIMGYSEDEDGLITNDPTYGPLENNKIVLESGKADDIAAKYGECFTDSQGTMISKGLIRMDGNSPGNVVPNEGLCAPDNLSYNSPDPLAFETGNDSSHSRDLIFRWRLYQYGYPASVAQLGERSVGASQ